MQPRLRLLHPSEACCWCARTRSRSSNSANRCSNSPCRQRYVRSCPLRSLLNQHKFEAVVVDLQLGAQANAILERIRLSTWNRTAVLFTISDTDAETASAFKAGSNFVLKRPLSLTAIDRSLKVAYGLIVRERRRYFRCPVEIPAKICKLAIPEIHGQTVNISEGGFAIASLVCTRSRDQSAGAVHASRSSKLRSQSTPSSAGAKRPTSDCSSLRFLPTSPLNYKSGSHAA